MITPTKNQPPITLGLRVLDNPAWTAGEIYVRNVAYSIGSLPESERPRVRLIGMLGANERLARELLGFDFINSYYAPGVGGVQRFIHRLWRKARIILLGAKADPELDGVDISFPGFQANRGVNDLYWIPDFQEEHLSHLFSKDEIFTRRNKNAAIANSEGILILSSQNALDDFNHFFPNATVKQRVWSFCSVLTEAENGGANPQEVYGLPEKYLYLPNQFWQHKDHMTAFKAILKLKQAGIEIPLVCTGKEQDHRNQVYIDELKSFALENDLSITFLGLVPRNDQIEIFRHSAGVLQPSLFEGWSTVVEDARAIGCPILMSDIAVHIEQAPKDGIYFKAGDAQDLAKVLAEWWPDLSPQQDPQNATAARAAMQQRSQDVARKFLAIVKDAL